MNVGTRFRETRVMFGKEATEEMWVTEFVPNRSMTIRADGCGCEYTTVYTFEDRGAATHVRLEMTIRPGTFLAWLMIPLGWIMTPFMRKCFAQDMEDLGTALEGGRPELAGGSSA